MSSTGVNAALRLAFMPGSPALDQQAISSALYAITRDCRWKITGFHWRPTYCTFHLCFATTADRPMAIVVGADAPLFALSNTSGAGEELQYVDDAAFSSAASGYAPTVPVLLAADLRRELTEADQAWLVGQRSDMEYNLKYWRPSTAGDVIFNTWD